MRRLVLAALLLPTAATAQFVLQQSNTTVGLRGIANVDGKVAWASGGSGTVLRTLDGGNHWMPCATPPNAEKLDFRGIQAFDDKTAVIMSSGKGDSSRIYQTSDGCATWKLAFTNPDAPDGFFDAMHFTSRDQGWLLGDPVKGSFYLAQTTDGGAGWTQSKSPDLNGPTKDIGAFAASNQSFAFTLFGPMFGGGAGYLYRGVWPGCSQSQSYNDPAECLNRIPFDRIHLPFPSANGGSGIFAISSATLLSGDAMSNGTLSQTLIAVGGDYTTPASAIGTAAYSHDVGLTWQPATTLPGGYRSTVAHDAATKTWITTGPNGTDISTDNGMTWKPLTPAKGDAPDADKNWNALSLPFVVGPKGRIGRLRPDALRSK
jgi:photosystem II stability/assembly factor-like uncharacterized protein